MKIAWLYQVDKQKKLNCILTLYTIQVKEQIFAIKIYKILPRKP